MTQLTFKWPERPNYAREDFVVTSANEEAVRFLESWADAPFYSALLSGPEACGKTHLAHNWATRMQACFIPADRLGGADSETLWRDKRHAVLEDVHLVTEEAALFHLLRHAETHGLFLLLTARMDASRLPFQLPDLRSRLLAMPQAFIRAPDEDVLRMFLFKIFADRQLRVGDDVIGYLLKRMERSFAAALKLASQMERQLFITGKEITIATVKSLLR